MSGLLKVLSAITPPPAQPAAREYDGWELRWKMLVFRPAMFKFEGVVLGVLAGYLLLYFIGRFINMSRAKATIKPFEKTIDSQFKVSRPLLSSGPSLHLLYSTGRRNVLCMHSTITLTPLHDIASLAIHYGKAIIEPAYDVSETVLFDLTLGRGADGLQGEGLGVWAIADKSAMRDIREKRWDLTFPRLHDSSIVPVTHALFAEHSDVTDVLMKTSGVGISDVLSDPKAASVLKYLLVTDQPARRPAKGPLPAKFRSREILLCLYKPKNAAQVEAAKAWLQVALNIADLESRPNLLKPDVARKLVKTRQQVDLDLTSAYSKEVAEDAPKEETAEERRLAKKKAERAQMSEKELKRLEELEKKREMRKMQKRGIKGGAQ
ncbi:hypothetical protein JCM24511_03512 [Saitozyma sp. JCM 24511]|nr:hypothetical protein JCM24511_03512 [Saitozyma sp. JCM 24511]